MDVRAIVVGLSTALLVGCGGDAPGQSSGQAREERPVAVTTLSVAAKPLRDELGALGTANANESVEITTRISSLVSRVVFKEGQQVEKDQVLVELESSEIRAELAVAGDFKRPNRRVARGHASERSAGTSCQSAFAKRRRAGSVRWQSRLTANQRWQPRQALPPASLSPSVPHLQAENRS